MQKIIVSALLCSVILWQGCTTTSPTTGTAAKTKTAAKAATPVVSAAALEQGKTLYSAKCQRCHVLHKSSEYTAAEWLVNVNSMAGKAKITDAEKDLIYAFVSSDCKK